MQLCWAADNIIGEFLFSSFISFFQRLCGIPFYVGGNPLYVIWAVNKHSGYITSHEVVWQDNWFSYHFYIQQIFYKYSVTSLYHSKDGDRLEVKWLNIHCSCRNTHGKHTIMSGLQRNNPNIYLLASQIFQRKSNKQCYLTEWEGKLSTHCE